MPTLKIGIPVPEQFYLGYYIMSYSAVTTKLSQTWLFSHQVKSNSSPLHGLQHHARHPCPSPSPRVCQSSCPLHQWCHPIMSSSVTLFSCLQSFPASGSFPISQLFLSGGQSIGASASASILPLNTQGWFPFIFYLFFLMNFYFLLLLFFTLHYCIGFAIHQHASATGVHVFPILNPPLTSLPIPSLCVIPVHQPQASCILHRTWTGNSFLIWYYTCFNAILPNHPPAPSPTEPKRLFYTSVSLLPSHIYMEFRMISF